MLNIEENILLSNITTLGIGGPATKFVSVLSEEELKEAIKYAKAKRAKSMNYLIIGGGSNLLVNDAGINSLVVKNEIAGIKQEDEIVRVKSGSILQDLVDYSIAHGLSGLQKLTGIPGTVGGAVYGNAGAYGQTVSDNILSVVVLSDPELVEGEPKDLSQLRVTLSKNECGFGYRNSAFKRTELPILEVTFQLETGDPKTLQKEADEVFKKRLVKYPKGIKCPGSFFKNIVAETLPKEVLGKIPKEAIVYGKLPAGFLLEKVGAKGQALDGIYIADHHANLFINKGNGTAKAFYDLAKKYANLVKEKFGITLEPEVQLINLPPII